MNQKIGQANLYMKISEYYLSLYLQLDSLPTALLNPSACGQILREKGEQRQYWGTGNIRKLRLGEQWNKPNYFRGGGGKGTATHHQGSVGPKRQILGVIRAKSDGSGESEHLSLV